MKKHLAVNYYYKEIRRIYGTQRRIYCNKVMTQLTWVDLDDAECSRMATSLKGFFIDKLQRIRRNIEAALSLMVSVAVFQVRRFTGNHLSNFCGVSETEVFQLIAQMSKKSSPMDAIPSSLLNSCDDVFCTIIARLANISFRDGCFPTSFKTAQITPLLENQGL